VLLRTSKLGGAVIVSCLAAEATRHPNICVGFFATVREAVAAVAHLRKRTYNGFGSDVNRSCRKRGREKSRRLPSKKQTSRALLHYATPRNTPRDTPRCCAPSPLARTFLIV